MPNTGQQKEHFMFSPLTHVLLGIWAGFLTGIGEVAILATKKYLLHDIHIIHSPHFVWMSPLANMCIFGTIGLILVLISFLRPKTISIRSSIVVFTFLWIVSLVAMYPGLNLFLVLVFSIGPAILISRIIFLNIQGFYLFARKTLLIFLIMGSFVSLFLISRETILEYQTINELPAPISKHTPNVLFIVLDTVRAQSLSLYGYNRETTPRLKEFAATGVRFSGAISTASWTLPSHGSMFTGHLAHELSTNWRRPLDETYPTLAEVLRKAGYLTAGFVANLEYCSYVYGLNRGFIHYEDFELSLGEFAISASLIRRIFTVPNNRWFSYYELLNRKTAPEINRSFLDWLSQTKKGGRPFFAFLNYFDAHEPYLPPSPYIRSFTTDVMSRPFADLWKKYTPAEAAGLQDMYEGAIAYLDSQIGNLLDELQDKGVLENTIVIITSDHGEEFSEHGIPSHGHSLYSPTIHVPLIISFPPKVPKGKIVSEWVSLRDLPATITELINHQNFTPERVFPGESLARHWNKENFLGDNPAKLTPILSEVRYAMFLPQWYPVSKGDIKSMIAQDLHYIVGSDGKEEIYDLRKDPWETEDLSETSTGQELAICLRDQLQKSISRTNQKQKINFTKKMVIPLPSPQGATQILCNNLLLQRPES